MGPLSKSYEFIFSSLVPIDCKFSLDFFPSVRLHTLNLKELDFNEWNACYQLSRYFLWILHLPNHLICFLNNCVWTFFSFKIYVCVVYKCTVLLAQSHLRTHARPARPFLSVCFICSLFRPADHNAILQYCNTKSDWISIRKYFYNIVLNSVWKEYFERTVIK